jgi:tetratricopeptide (TPR) repeat protein
MDRRKLLCLGGFILGAATGCTRHEVVNSDPYAPAAVQSAARPAERKRKAEPPVKEADLKPETFVKFATMQSEAAVNEELASEQRNSNAQLAKQNYSKALQLDPNCLSATVGLARLCSALGDHEQAVTLLDKALQKKPEMAGLWYERGMVMGRQKQFDAALANLRKAYQLEPTNTHFNKSVGLMMARMGQPEEAVAWLKKTMGEADARYNVAHIMRHLGQEAEAKRQLSLALGADPGHQPTLVALGMAQAPAADTPPAAAPTIDPLQLTTATAQPATLPQRPAVQTPAPKRPSVQIGFEPN